MKCAICRRPMLRAFVEIGGSAIGPKCAERVLLAGRKKRRQVRLFARIRPEPVDPRQMTLLEAVQA